ncbi:MAG: hypothetical protein J0651_03440, partial [Actinobacteria bacterium]|nr:hypothetical protein [Actinomycetota bacterium]
EYMERYTDTETNITVDILYSDDRIDPEASVVGLAIQATAFDTTVNVCIPEMAIWLCLHSNQTRHKADIVELAKKCGIDPNGSRDKLCEGIAKKILSGDFPGSPEPTPS